MGRGFNHPPPLEFKHRLKKYILAKHSSSVFAMKANCKEITFNEHCLVKLSTIVNTNNEKTNNTDIKHNDDKTIVLTQDVFDSLIDGDDINWEMLENNEVTMDNLSLDELTEDVDEFSKAGLHYTAGFVAHRFKGKYPSLQQPMEEVKDKKNCPNWIMYNARFKLTVPSDDLWKLALIMEKKFLKMHGDRFSYEENIIDKLVCEIEDECPNLNVPSEVIKLLVKTRTYFRIRKFNSRNRILVLWSEKRNEIKKLKKCCRLHHQYLQYM